MCNGDCKSCKTPCGLTGLVPDLAGAAAIGGKNINAGDSGRKSEDKMSEAVGGCHAGQDEKIGRLDERSNFNRERNSDTKIFAIVSAVVALIALFIAWTALRDLDALKRELSEFKMKTDSIVTQTDEAQRAYTNARKSLERARKCVE